MAIQAGVRDTDALTAAGFIIALAPPIPSGKALGELVGQHAPSLRAKSPNGRKLSGAGSPLR